MAAKTITISTDAANWVNLPGSQGTFNADGESIDDTILGAGGYSSTEVGLLGWGISSDGIYKGFAGYKAEIKRVDLSAAAGQTAEAMTDLTGDRWQITDADLRIIDRTVVLSADDTGDVTGNIVSIDYLNGIVTFDSTMTTPTLTYTAHLRSLLETMAHANTYNLTMTAEAIDESYFDLVQANGGYRIFGPGLRTVSLELGGLWYEDADHDAKDDVIGAVEYIVEIDPAGDGLSFARGFFKNATASQSGAVGALEEETLNFQLVVPDETVNPQSDTPFKWTHAAGTTLNVAIQRAIAAWEGELTTYSAQYLPLGVETADMGGLEGLVIFSDISLSGGLDNMNTFNIEMKGRGAYTAF